MALAKKKANPKVALNPITSIVSFEQFKKSPVAAVAFLCICGMSFLYYRGESEREKMWNIVATQNEKIRKSDSTSAAALSQIQILKKLKQIPE
jgi:hypothetical protein